MAAPLRTAVSQRSPDPMRWLFASAGLILVAFALGVAYVVVQRVVRPALAAADEAGPNQVMTQTVAAMNELADILGGVNDVASAQAAAGKLGSFVERTNALKQRLDSLKTSLSSDEYKALQERHGQSLVSANQRVTAQIERIEGVAGAKEALASSLQAFQRGQGRAASATQKTQPPAIAEQGPAPHAAQPGAGSLAQGAPQQQNAPQQNMPQQGFAPPGPPGIPGAPQPGFGPGFGQRPGFPQPPNMDQQVQRMKQKHGSDKVATIIVEDLPDDVATWLFERIKEAARSSDFSGQSSGPLLTAVLAPAGDLDELAKRLDFGTVVKIDPVKRVITLRADPAKMPAPLGPEVTNPRSPNFYPGNLADLGCFDAQRRRRALERLKDAKPLQLRSEIAKAIEGLLLDRDAGTRKAALAAYGVWGGPEAVPTLVAALVDEDHGVREGALEGLSQLEGAFEKDEVIAGVAELFVKDRGQGSKWLELIGPAAEPTVLKYLKHPDGWVRLDAVKLLGQIGTEKSRTALRRAASGNDGLVPGAAREALEKIARRAKEE
jgi:hypothetical protein